MSNSKQDLSGANLRPECAICNGTGKVERTGFASAMDMDAGNEPHKIIQTCRICNGHGWVYLPADELTTMLEAALASRSAERVELESDICECGHPRMDHWNPSSTCYCENFRLSAVPDSEGSGETRRCKVCDTVLPHHWMSTCSAYDPERKSPPSADPQDFPHLAAFSAEQKAELEQLQDERKVKHSPWVKMTAQEKAEADAP